MECHQRCQTLYGNVAKRCWNVGKTFPRRKCLECHQRSQTLYGNVPKRCWNVRKTFLKRFIMLHQGLFATKGNFFRRSSNVYIMLHQGLGLLKPGNFHGPFFARRSISQVFYIASRWGIKVCCCWQKRSISSKILLQ